MEQLDDRIAVAFSRAITRRTVLRRGIGAAFVSAAAVTSSLTWPSKAKAVACTFTVNDWGCYCASTPFCGDAYCNNDLCTNGASRRCNYWPSAPYCWCSQRCYLTSNCGYYSCCDCWKYGGSCRSGTGGGTACICKRRYPC